MRIDRIYAENFKGFKELNMRLDGRSAVIFGVNGTGKSSALSIVNYLFYKWIVRLNKSQGKSFSTLGSELIRVGTSVTLISTDVRLNGRSFQLSSVYQKTKTGKTAAYTLGKRQYADFGAYFEHSYLSGNTNIPLFVHYGTNRAVTHTPLQSNKSKEATTQMAALERAIENQLDFGAFFEWFRNQEDLENEYKDETKDFYYEDIALRCVRTAVENMLDGVTSLKVKRRPLRMVVKKEDTEFRVDQLSDGEKCTLAMFGDLARRIALANPYRDNPLEGEGVVLIDEIDLHMHPSWQRKVLKVLKRVFPNVQFIVTTHSPQVLSEVNDEYAIFKLESNAKEGNQVIEISRMDGYDSNYILEEFMETASKNPEYQGLLDRAYDAISDCRFEEAQEILDKVASISGKSSADWITLESSLKRRKFLYEKNNQG